LKSIIKDKKIAIDELCKINKVGRSSIRDLNKLKKLNIIKRTGSDKTGYWEIIK